MLYHADIPGTRVVINTTTAGHAPDLMAPNADRLVADRMNLKGPPSIEARGNGCAIVALFLEGLVTNDTAIINTPLEKISNDCHGDS